MDKQMQKEELAVGIYGARIMGKLVSWKGKKGILTCSKCGSKWHSYLFPGNVGKCCWKPENLKVRNLRWNRNHNQSDETKELKANIVKLMVDRSITIKQVSEMIGIPKTSLANWFRGQFGKEGQKNMANRIRPKIDLLLSEK
jgi:ribosomal protein L37E